MASELLKNRALIQRLKEPKLPDVDFSLSTASFESTLPEPKPQELLDIQENVRIQRQQDTMNKARPFLMDESVDFIERQEKAIGGGVIEGKNLGTREGFAKPISAERLKFLNEEAVKEGYPDYFSIDPKTERAVRIRVGQAATRRMKGVAEGKGRPGVERTKKEKTAIKKSHWANKSKAEVDAILSSPKYKEYWSRKTQNQADLLKAVQSGKYNTSEEIRKAVNFNKDVFDKEVANLFKNVYTQIGDLNKPKKMQPRFGVTFLPRDLDKMYEIRSKLGQIDGFESVDQRNIYQQIDEAYGQRGTNPNRKAFAEATKKASDFSRIKNAIKAKYPSIRLELEHPLDYKTIKGLGKGGEKFLFVTPVEKSINRGFKATLGDAYAKAVKAKDIDKILKIENLANDIGVTIGKVRGTKVMDYGTGPLRTTDIGQEIIDNLRKQNVIVDNIKKLEKSGELKTKLADIGMPRAGEIGYSAKKVSETKIKNIAKLLADSGFKCKLADGATCNNPMAYLDDIKKQQVIAQGSGNAAANAAKKLSTGRAIFREVLGPAALGFELAAAVPITYLGYKAGLPPARIISDATYGLFGETETARLKKIAVKEGIDTADIQKALDFEKASGAMMNLAREENQFRGPDDEMLFPQQYEKGEEDFYKAVGAFRDKEGNISKEVFQTISDQLKNIRGIAADEDAALRAEREAKIDRTGIGEYLTDGVIPEQEQTILPFYDFQEPSTRMDFSEGGPNDPSRRTFLKFLAGIASLPVVGKFFKAAKAPKVVKLSNTTTTMPDWFPSFIDKAFEKGIAKKVDADITEIEIPELPSVKVRKYDDGRIEVEGKNGYGEPYEIDYTPPGYELVDEKTGKAVKTPGEFQANDTVYRRVGPEGDDFDVDFEVVDDVEQILGGDSTKLEGFAKGTKKDKYTIGQRNIDAAEAAQERADVFEGPDIDLSDYED